MKANTDYPVHNFIAQRWSPYFYSSRPVAKEDLKSLFEAARWTQSSYNEQPWAYLLAVQGEPEEFERMLGVLVEGNQAWAKHAPVLALGLARHSFSRNGKSNHHALHDLGAASTNLTFEATARGLAVHQMSGILPDLARERFALPDEWEAVTALAIGYPGDAGLESELATRDAARRPRKPLTDFVFTGSFGTPASMVTASALP